MTRDFPWITIPRERRELLSRCGTKQLRERPPRCSRQLSNGTHTDVDQPRLSDGAHAPQQFDRQIVKEVQFGAGIDNYQSVGLGRLRGDFRQVLGARHAD